MLHLPLAGMSKDEVRAIAAQAGLPCACAPDSQEICFIPDNDYPSYIEERFGKMPEGEFVSPEGTVCGTHKGLLHYTVGQRKGLGIALGRPVFIKSMDPQTNRIYLGDAGEEFASGVLLRDCRWIPFEEPAQPMRSGAKIRSMAKEAAAQIIPLPGGAARVLFDTPQRAPAPGQSCIQQKEPCFNRYQQGAASYAAASPNCCIGLSAVLGFFAHFALCRPGFSNPSTKSAETW